MTNPTHIDPSLAARKCSKLECDVVMLRNATPPMRWSSVAGILGCTQGEARRLWSSANRKVNGGYVPVKRTAAEDRAIAVTDPDIIRGLRGIPTVGLSRSGAATVPGKPTRSGRIAS